MYKEERRGKKSTEKGRDSKGEGGMRWKGGKGKRTTWENQITQQI